MGKRNAKIPGLKERVRYATAVHEAGHAVSSWFEPSLPIVRKVTIKRRGGNLGRTVLKFKQLHMAVATADVLRAMIRLYLAARAAERICIGAHAVGVGGDILQATQLANLLVLQEGMDTAYGPVNFAATTASEHTRARADKAVSKILHECAAQVEKDLKGRKRQIMKVAEALLKKRSLKTRHLKKILGPRPSWPQLKLLKLPAAKKSKKK